MMMIVLRVNAMMRLRVGVDIRVGITILNKGGVVVVVRL